MSLYGDLPTFDAEDFDRIMREAKPHKIIHTSIPSKRKEVQLTIE